MSFYRTPLRYPGGKQKVAPFILEVIEANGLLGGHYVEPYAGGAGVAFELLMEGKLGHVHLNDKSRAIYSFWSAVVNDTENLCRKITSASLTVEEWKKQREVIRHPDDHSDFDLGFATLFMNRCNRSGVLAGGVIGGLNQDGPYKLDARFSRISMISRVQAIASRSHLITISNLDAEEFLTDYVSSLPHNTLVYCDPPYFNKSARLYLNKYGPGDHVRISRVIQKEVARPWLVSYDSAPEILALYEERRHFVYGLQYQAHTVYKGKEVFVFSDGLRIPSNSRLPYIQAGLCTLTKTPGISKRETV